MAVLYAALGELITVTRLLGILIVLAAIGTAGYLLGREPRA